MVKRNVKCTGKSNNQIDEAPLPVPLRITLCTLLAMGAAPARLRRTRTGWLLAASPSLATFQRLIAVVVNILTLSDVILDFQLEAKDRFHVGTTALKNCMAIVEVCVTMLIHSLGVSAALNMRLMVTLLQEIQKIKNSLNRITFRVKYDRLKLSLLTFYILWNAVTHTAAICRIFDMGKLLVSSMWTVAVYQTLVATLVQLHWSMALEEINCTRTFINDNLEVLLKRTVIMTPKFGCNSTRLLNVSYDTIFELLRRLHDHYGPFLCIYFLFLFLSLLLSPYNILVALERNNSLIAVEQANWTLLHFIRLITLVEPCHRLQKQKHRTGRLLSALAHQATRRRQLPLYLKPFILHNLISDSPLALCDTFTVSRSVLASVIGGVVTYLIIIVQADRTAEIL